MMTRTTFKCLCFMAAISLLSCQKEAFQNSKSAAGIIFSYFNLEDSNKSNGSISFNCNKTFGEQAKAAYQISGVLTDKEGNLIKQGDLKILDVVIKPTWQGIISTDIKVNDQIGSLYGKNLTVQAFRDSSSINTNNSERLLNSSFRLPSEIVVLSPSASRTIETISQTETIKWIPDANNTKKILIVVEFDPTRSDNSSFKFNLPKAHYVEVPDNGSHQLSPKEFKGIPNGSSITVYVARGNNSIATSTSGNEQYRVWGYSMARHQFRAE